MKWLIDGYNLLFSQPELRHGMDSDGLEAARGTLVSRVGARATDRGVTAVIVFDGSPEVVGASREETIHGVRCVYSAGQGKADRRILTLLEESDRPEDWLVVSSDREVAAGARRRSARVQGADSFWRDLSPKGNAEKPGAKDRPLSPREVDEWRRYFGFGDDDR